MFPFFPFIKLVTTKAATIIKYYLSKIDYIIFWIFVTIFFLSERRQYYLFRKIPKLLETKKKKKNLEKIFRFSDLKGKKKTKTFPQ